MIFCVRYVLKEAECDSDEHMTGIETFSRQAASS